MKINPQRTRNLNNKTIGPGPIVYWMSRDQRVNDNWALLYAQQLAKQYQQPLVVVFCVAPNFLGATLRQYDFMLRGLQQVEQALKIKNIPFVLLTGDVTKELPKFVTQNKVGAVVTDFSPLRIGRLWRKKIAKKLPVALYEVDAHNIVPAWVASLKQEFAAYTFRPKITKLIPKFLEEFPKVQKQAAVPISFKKSSPINWKTVYKKLRVDVSVAPVDWIKPGEKAALQNARKFFVERLKQYNEDRNDPTKDAQSDISPYLHYGHMAAQRVALWAQEQSDTESRATFLEELIVRQELSDNFCLYNEYYDSVEGFSAWAKKSMAEHRHDDRPVMYSLKQLESANTYDDLWNASQKEMMTRGKMHGYMRMYWAKKILECTPDAETALKYAIYLNDKYELDGRDPNGYVGIMWSIGGVHDRAWFRRPIFGQVRYMSYNGAKGKFDIQKYIERYR